MPLFNLLFPKNMKKVLFLFLLLTLLGSSNTFAQTYLISSGGTVNTCSGTSYDSGGAAGNYGASQTFVQTFCATGGQCLRLTFTSFDLESGFDYLAIYNGPSIASPLIGNYTGTTSPGVITSTTGCLTLRFTSDFIINYTGWAATISCVTCGAPPPANPGDCPSAITVCTNLNFSVDPNGFGAINEVPTTNTVSNPSTNPASSNFGCLLSGELNSTWLLVTITSPGTLEFSFGDNTTPFPQSGCYDWIMWPYSATACANIANNTLPPVRCNWNSPCSGGTGICAPANLPTGAFSTNFEPLINVVTGQQFVICFSNYSGLFTNVPLRFFGTAGIACTLPIEFTKLSAHQEETKGILSWEHQGSNSTKTYQIEKFVNQRWKVVGQEEYKAQHSTHQWIDNQLEKGNNIYKLSQIDKDGNVGYQETVELWVNELPRYRVYPNPVTEVIHIQNLTIEEPHSVKILSYTGQVIHQEQLSGVNQWNFNMAVYAKGVYWISIDNQLEQIVKN